MVRFIPYILALLGDTPGQNGLCGKMKSPRAKRLCRYCDIEKLKLSYPWAKSRLVTKKMVLGWQLQPANLKKYRYKKVDIAWNKIGFGADPHGAHGNCPGEIIHTLNHGMMPMVLDGLFCSKAISAELRKENEKEKRAAVREATTHHSPDSTDDDNSADSDDDTESEDDLLELVALAAKEEKIRQNKEQ